MAQNDTEIWDWPCRRPFWMDLPLKFYKIFTYELGHIQQSIADIFTAPWIHLLKCVLCPRAVWNTNRSARPASIHIFFTGGQRCLIALRILFCTVRIGDQVDAWFTDYLSFLNNDFLNEKFLFWGPVRIDHGPFLSWIMFGFFFSFFFLICFIKTFSVRKIQVYRYRYSHYLYITATENNSRIEMATV